MDGPDAARVMRDELGYRGIILGTVIPTLYYKYIQA